MNREIGCADRCASRPVAVAAGMALLFFCSFGHRSNSLNFISSPASLFCETVSSVMWPSLEYIIEASHSQVAVR